MDGVIPVRFLKSVLNNGVTRYVPQLQRLTFQFSKIRASDRGVREFVEKNVETFCKQHPSVVVYVLPIDSPNSRIIAEYLNGNNLTISPEKMNVETVEYWVHMFLSKSGQRDFKLKNMHHTEVPSVQGQWTPLTYKHKQLFAHKFTKKFDESSSSFKIEIEPAAASEQNPTTELSDCPESVNDVAATNGLFTRVGAF